MEELQALFVAADQLASVLPLRQPATAALPDSKVLVHGPPSAVGQVLRTGHPLGCLRDRTQPAVAEVRLAGVATWRQRGVDDPVQLVGQQEAGGEQPDAA